MQAQAQAQLRTSRIGKPDTKLGINTTGQFNLFERGPSQQIIPGLAEASCSCVIQTLERLKSVGLATNFIGSADETTIVVREFEPLPGRSVTGRTNGKTFPALCYWYNTLSGSLWENYSKGSIAKRALGFSVSCSPDEGDKLPSLLLEYSTSSRHMTSAAAQRHFWNFSNDWERMEALAKQAVQIMNDGYEAVGYSVPSGAIQLGYRLEPAADHKYVREFVVLGAFGSPDEVRPLDTNDGGYGLNYLRDYLIRIGWKATLDEARKEFLDDPSRWPVYPAIPDSILSKMGDWYQQVAADYTGGRVW